MIIKKIFDGNFDDEVHDHFIKFSRGDFKDKYLVNAKKQANKWAIKTGPEFANFFVSSGLSNCSGPIKVSGIISTTLDLSGDIKFEIEKIGNFQGVKKYVINTEVNPEEITSLVEKYPRAFFALSFSNSDMDIKIKAKPPKSGKPGKGDEEVKADFCTIKTNKEEVVREFFFDVGIDWKEIAIKHDILIDGIVYPKDMAGLKPAEIREQSKRKGKIVRRIVVDGRERVEEASFVA